MRLCGDQGSGDLIGFQIDEPELAWSHDDFASPPLVQQSSKRMLPISTQHVPAAYTPGGYSSQASESQGQYQSTCDTRSFGQSRKSKSSTYQSILSLARSARKSRSSKYQSKYSLHLGHSARNSNLSEYQHSDGLTATTLSDSSEGSPERDFLSPAEVHDKRYGMESPASYYSSLDSHGQLVPSQKVDWIAAQKAADWIAAQKANAMPFLSPTSPLESVNRGLTKRLQVHVDAAAQEPGRFETFKEFDLMRDSTPRDRVMFDARYEQACRAASEEDSWTIGASDIDFQELLRGTDADTIGDTQTVSTGIDVDLFDLSAPRLARRPSKEINLGMDDFRVLV